MTVIIERAWLDHNGHHIGIQVQAYSIPPRNLDEIELCPKLRGIGAKCVQSDVRVVRRSVNACVSGKSGPTYAGVLRFQLPQTMMLRNDDTPSSFFSRQGGDLYLLYGKNENISPVSIRDHLCLGRVDQFEANKGIRRKLMSDEEIQQAKEKEDQRQRRLLRTPPTPKEVNLQSPNASQTRVIIPVNCHLIATFIFIFSFCRSTSIHQKQHKYHKNHRFNLLTTPQSHPIRSRANPSPGLCRHPNRMFVPSTSNQYSKKLDTSRR